jgi:hypothetical protein
MVHDILIEGEAFVGLVFGHIFQLVLDVVADPGEFSLHGVVLIAEFGPGFCEELQLLVLAVDEQLVQMHEEVVQFLHQLRVLPLCLLQIVHCPINALPGDLQIVLDHACPVLDVLLHAVGGLSERDDFVPLVDGGLVHAARAEQLLVLQAVHRGDVVMVQALLGVVGLEDLRVEVDGRLYLFLEGVDQLIHLSTGKDNINLSTLLVQYVIITLVPEISLGIGSLVFLVDSPHQLVAHCYNIWL